MTVARSGALPPAVAPGLRAGVLAGLATLPPIEAAEAFRDLPGLALLESARPGRRARWSYLTADPLAVIEAPGPVGQVFDEARRALVRLAPEASGGRRRSAEGPAAGTAAGAPGRWPPFAGGLVGFVGYDVGRSLERLPALARADLDLPELRLALHDWVIAWDRREGVAWLAGRAVDGDESRLVRRLREVLARLEGGAGSRGGTRSDASAPSTVAPDGPRFTSSLPRDAYQRGVERVRESIAAGEIYQANLTRRLETAFDGDPWPLYRRLRTGDPSLFAAYLDLGPGEAGRPRAICSASPEPFLALAPDGTVATDPIKGTRPRGATPEVDRALAAELLGSAKDRAENVMIVDVLRNDLGRVCEPGSVRVPRLCRLERTATVQHLVSTVTGRLAAGRDAFDLLAATVPGGSITGAPKIRAMEIVEGLEPVRRGPYTGSLCWIGPDGAMGSSILIRTFVADGHRLTLGVGGGITRRSDPAREWEETVVKAAGPLRAIGGREVEREDGEPAGGSDAGGIR